MSELNDLLDLLDLALGRGESILDEATRDRGAELRHRLRVRGHFVDEALTIAVAGGTGSGKSSLVNALVGETVVESGVLRPTTQIGTAVVPGRFAASLEPLVEALEADDVVPTTALDDRVIVDLPDYDSVEVAHRDIVERIVPNVDVVIWVADPEKYADPIVREAFLAPMLPYERQFMFVLNKVDLLGDRAQDVASHFEAMLDALGYDAAEVLPASAAPRHGAEPDTRSVVRSLTHRFDTKRAALAKVALDLRFFANDAWRGAVAQGTASGRFDHALAAATFVSLGVAGYGLYDRVAALREMATAENEHE